MIHMAGAPVRCTPACSTRRLTKITAVTANSKAPAPSRATARTANPLSATAGPVGASSANRNDPSNTTVSGMNQIPEMSSAWNCSCSNAATKNTTVRQTPSTVPTPARVTTTHQPAELLRVAGHTRIAATARTLIAPGMVA